MNQQSEMPVATPLDQSLAEHAETGMQLNEKYEHMFWRRVEMGSLRAPLYRYTFGGPIGIQNGEPIKIHATLGHIQASNDSRWNWFAKSRKKAGSFLNWNPDGLEQGREHDFWDAVAKIMSCIPREHYVQNFYEKKLEDYLFELNKEVRDRVPSFLQAKRRFS